MHPPAVASLDVVGRTRELADIEALLGAPARFPAAISLIGAAGIGKSTLWHWAIEFARSRDYACLVSRPAEAEASLAFTVLGDLFATVMPEVSATLPRPQLRALEGALLLDEAGSTPDPRTVGVAVLSVLRALAAKRSVLIAIDDEQWMDPASAAILGFALRRLRNEPVACVVARRDGSPGARLETRLPTTAVELSGLSLGALHAMVVDRIGTVLPRSRLRRLHELCGGNPFLAMELLRAEAAGRLNLAADAPITADVDRLVGARLDALPSSTRAALLAAAATSRPSVATLSGVVGPGAAADLRPAIAAGIVEVHGEEVRFTHPLLASAAYGAGSTEERRTVHGRMAKLGDDPVERARHLALAATEPEETVAAEVERAAASVFRRGAPASAAALAQLAARLTPADLGAERRRRTAAHAEYLFESGDTAAAAALLESLIASTPGGPERARLLALLARIRHFGDDVAAGVALNEQALAESGSDDLLTAGIHEGLAWGRFLMRDDLQGAAQHARAAVEAAERAGDDVAIGEALAVQALTSQAIGRPDEAALERAVALEPAFRDLRVLRHPSYARAYALACMDRLAEARATFDDLLVRASEHGDESAVPSILVQQSMAEILAGEWDAADRSAARGDELAEQEGQRPSQAALRGRRALIAVLRGRLDEGEALARQALMLAGEPAAEPAGEALHDQVPTARAFARGGEVAAWALGACHLTRGAPALADACLRPLREALIGAGLREPGELRFLPDSVEALLGLHDADAAQALVGEMLAMARETGRATALALAERSQALVLADGGDTAAAVEHAEAAVRLLEPGSLPFEAARAQLVLGSIQRRRQQKRAARAALSVAAAAFRVLGAQLWAERADGELERVGGRPPSGTDLTATERRVAELVADGLANKEVAAALGISTKTVEVHLSHVYAKLDVGSRTELVRLFAGGNP